MLQVDSAELKGNGTVIRVSGSLPVQGAGDMNLAANGTLDLGLLQDWTEGGHSSGQVDVEITAKGKEPEPTIQGRVRIANAVYTSDALPVGIESLNGDISIEGNRLQIANLSGTAGGGTVSVSGSAVYGNNTRFDLALGATLVRVRQNGVRAVVWMPIFPGTGRPPNLEVAAGGQVNFQSGLRFSGSSKQVVSQATIPSAILPVRRTASN